MKRIRRLRQLIPTKFATGHRVQAVEITHSTIPVQGEGDWRPVFSTWWMWLGRCYRVKHTAI
jgi:hypothetical protein